jgi:large subunit ribosomal protein L17
MYRNLVTSLFEHERVKTTDAKAKGVRSLAEKMITLGKRGDLHARRRALRVIRRREVAAKVFDDLAERYRDRPGGYTRILKLGIRPGDAASMSIIELVESDALEGRASKADTKGDAKATKKTAGKAAAKAKKKTEKAPEKKAPKKKVAAKKDSETASKKKALAKKSPTAKKKAVRKKKTD